MSQTPLHDFVLAILKQADAGVFPARVVGWEQPRDLVVEIAGVIEIRAFIDCGDWDYIDAFRVVGGTWIEVDAFTDEVGQSNELFQFTPVGHLHEACKDWRYS